MKPSLSCLLFCVVCLTSVLSGSRIFGGGVTVYPAPAGEEMAADYKVRVEGEEVPVYAVKVAPRDPGRRWKAMDDKANSADYFEKAAFAYFDVEGGVEVTVTCAGPVRSARVLPSALGIRPVVGEDSVRWRMEGPGNLTLEVNGTWVNALHLFANPPERNVPSPEDPDVIYFGPGIHEVSHLEVGSGKTVYVAGGAVVRGVIDPDEPYRISGYSGLRTYSPTFELRGENITLRGRGIIDGSRSTTHARHLVSVRGTNIALEGVILRDASVWTVPVRSSEKVKISGLKLLGYRANSDGIDICNSREVAVEGCFIRTLDDLIVVKSDRGQGEVRDIVAKECVLWNEVAHALSVGAELREDVRDVVFTNCDVIHDLGREWTLRVYHSDAALVSNIRFDNIRVEESRRLISAWIGQAVWSRDKERGRIRDVMFKNIEAAGEPLRVELKGFDAEHAVENVEFEGVILNGRALSVEDVKTNAHVRNIRVRPDSGER